jgi:hypothetical protein
MVSAVACTRQQEVAPGPVRLGPEWVALASDALEVRGPQSDLCVVMPNERPVVMSARLVTGQGDSVDLGRPGTSTGQQVSLCFDGNGRLAEGQRYRAVALRAEDTVTVPRVTWRSGRRYKLLP